MSSDNYISDYKLGEIRKEYGRKIISFSDVQQQLQKWYLGFGLSYPSSSINNYRDSWFHYRKIWLERSFYEVVCQMATLDEHLQRAEKDAVVNFFQIISQELEFWYCIEKRSTLDGLQAHIQQKVKAAYADAAPEEQENGLWLYRLWSSYDGIEQEAALALMYAAKEYILDSKELKQQIQRLLHLIKNATIEIRFEASDIRRLRYPGEYLKRYQNCYDTVYAFFAKEENRGLFFLLGMTKIVKIHDASYAMEEERYSKYIKGATAHKAG